MFDLEAIKEKLDTMDIEEEDNHKTLISIIMTIDKDSMIEEYAIKSILNQTFRSFELLVVDSPEVIANPKIKYIKKKDITKSINKMSKYIMYTDSGKILHNTLLETLFTALLLNKEYDYAYSDIYNLKTKMGYNLKYNYNINLEKQHDILCPLIRKEKIIKSNSLTNLLKNLNSIHLNFYGVFLNKEIDSLDGITDKKSLCLDFPREVYNWEVLADIVLPYTPKKKDKKKNILMIVPWMVMGGADLFNLDFLRLLNKDKYHITLVSIQSTKYLWRSRFEKYVDELFDLSTFLDRKDFITFIDYLIESRNINLIFNTNSTLGYAAIPYLKNKHPLIPIIDYIHMEEWYNRNGGYSRDSAVVTKLIDKTIFCNKNSERIFNNYFKVPKEKTDTIYIGVDEKRFDPEKYDKKELLAKYLVDDEKINIGYICRIASQKRPLLLLEIIKKICKTHQDINFLIAGDGPLLEKLKEEVTKARLDNYVKFLGSFDKAQEFYKLCDLTLNCSIKEGLALTSYESLSMSVAVISSDVGGQKELIDESCGVIVPLVQEEKDIDDTNYSEEEIMSYVLAIEKVIKNLDYYKTNARKRILKDFTLDKMITRIEEEIDSVLEKPNQEIINNAKKLDGFQEILKEHYSYYLLASKYHIEYLVNTYNEEVYPIVKGREKGRIVLIKKLHIYSEYLLIKDFFKSFIKVLIFPIRFLLLEITKLIKAF